MTPEKIIQISVSAGEFDRVSDVVYALTNYGNIYMISMEGGNRTYVKLPDFTPGKATKTVK